jgi:hypothetical protein
LFRSQQLRRALKKAFARFGWIGRRFFFLGPLLLSSVTSLKNDSVFNHRGHREAQRLEYWALSRLCVADIKVLPSNEGKDPPVAIV